MPRRPSKSPRSSWVTMGPVEAKLCENLKVSLTNQPSYLLTGVGEGARDGTTSKNAMQRKFSLVFIWLASTSTGSDPSIQIGWHWLALCSSSIITHSSLLSPPQ